MSWYFLPQWHWLCWQTSLFHGRCELAHFDLRRPRNRRAGLWSIIEIAQLPRIAPRVRIKASRDFTKTRTRRGTNSSFTFNVSAMLVIVWVSKRWIKPATFLWGSTLIWCYSNTNDVRKASGYLRSINPRDKIHNRSVLRPWRGVASPSCDGFYSLHILTLKLKLGNDH